MFNLMFWRRRQPWWQRYGAGIEMKMPSFEMPHFKAPEMPHVSMPNVSMPNVSMPNVSMPDMPYYHRQSGFDWGRWWPYMLGAALVGAAFAYFYKQGFAPMQEYVYPNTSRENGAPYRETAGAHAGY
jgi:hypothetical protein